MNMKCPACNGNGWLLSRSGGVTSDVDCDFCDGAGNVSEDREFDL